MSLHRSFLLLCAGVLLAAGAHAATDVKSPQGLLKGQVPDDAAALKRIAITGFFVQYVTDFGIETKRKRGGTFHSKWKEPKAEQLQDAANALYAQLAADLKAAGIEVVAADQVAAQAAMADLRKVGRPSPAALNDSSLMKGSLLVAAQDLPLVLATVPDVKLSSYATQPIEGTDAPGNLIGWDRVSTEWLAAGNAEVMSLATIYFGYAKVAQGLNATALNVRLTVPLVDLGVTTAGNAGGGLFGSAKVTGLIKPNPRFVEAGTVFSFSQAGGNPGHRHVVGLQKPVPIEGLKVSSHIEQKTLDDTIFGVGSARGQGLLGALANAAGANNDAADFWVSVEPAELQPALVQAGSTLFRELAQILARP